MTAAHLGSILNSAMRASGAKFKKEPKCAAVKVTALTKFALVVASFFRKYEKLLALCAKSNLVLSIFEYFE